MSMRAGMAALVVAMVMGSAVDGLADAGSNGIAWYRVKRATDRTWVSSFSLSNVSPRDVQVTLKLYDQNGNPVGSGGFTPIITIEGALTSCNPANTSCTLPAGKAGNFIVSPTATVGADWYGHGSFEWSSATDDTQTTALMGQGFLTITPNVSGDQILLPLVMTRPLPF